jgi:hypothetical protein
VDEDVVPSPVCRSATRTGVTLSLRALTTPCAPMVITPQVTFVQSTVCTLPSAPGALKVDPGTRIVVDQVPFAAIMPPLAALAVESPGKATNFW